jgi:outer membrane protein TolC
MREAVHLALANNNNIKLQRYAPDLGDAQVRAAFGAFDPILGISFTYNNTETPQNAEQYIATGGQSTATQLTLIETLEQILAEIRGEEVAASTGQPIREPNIFHAENYIGRIELGGKLPIGTRYGFRINADSFVNDINIVQPPGIYSPEYASYAGFVLTQPLLRDFGFNANMAEVNVARANRQIGWYDWKAQMIASLYDTLAAYIDLLFAESDVAVKREAAEMARMLERQNTRRMELGQMGPVDVSQAQSAVAEAEEREFLSLSFAVERQGALQRVVLGEAPPDALWFSPNERLKIPPIKPDRSKMIMEAYQLRPEYLRATEEVKKQDVLVRYFRNQVLPRVDAQISYGVSGLSGNYGSSFNSALGGQGFDFGAGVLVSVPLGSVKERADLDASKMRKAQADIALSQVALNVSVEIDTALSLIEAARARITAAEDFLAAATKNLESEQLMLEEGRSTTFNVVKFQNDLALARTRLLGAQAEYRKSVLRLGVSSGKLLDELGVNIEQEAALLRPLKKNPPPAQVLR